MNQTMQHLQNDYEPFLAIVAYKHHLDKFYLEAHDVRGGKILEGKPLHQKTLTSIADCIYDDNQGKIKFGGIIPASLLLSETLTGGEYKLIWFKPEERRRMYFTKSLEIEDGEAWVPPMLYVATRQTLRVFALKNNRRPNEKTRLYKAPFYNVYETGSVCLGSAKVQEPTEFTFENVMQYWDDMFWKSIFTHMNGGNFCKTNGNVVWKRMLADDVKWTEIDELIETNKTIKSLI